MTFERFLYFVLGVLAIVLAVFILIFLIDVLRDETAGAAVLDAGRGWCRTCRPL